MLIHLAGITEQAAFPEIGEHNISAPTTCWKPPPHPRVVLASSHHTIGFTPISQQVTTTSAVAEVCRR